MLAMFAAGCKKKAPPPAPPPRTGRKAQAPPPPPRPAAPRVGSFSAEPGTVQRGQSSTLRWQVSGDVTSMSINQGIGAVQNTGNTRVSPSNSTTYILTATGAGGTTTANATVTVTSPPPPPPPPPAAAPARSLEDRLTSDLQDAYFDYDKSDIRSDAQAALTQDATALRSIMADFPSASIVLEGHCDERGSAEYNLGLGDRRASSGEGLPGATGSSRRPSEDHQLSAKSGRCVTNRTKPAGRKTGESISRRVSSRKRS